VSTFWDLDRAANRPERVPTRRQTLDELAVDEQQTCFVRLDLAVHDHWRTRRVELIQVALGNAHLGRGVDALDVDLSDRLPECPRRVRQHQVLRLAIERDDGDLACARLHDLEVLRGDRRMRLSEQQRLVRGDLRTRNLDNLCRQAATVVERDEAARAEQTLEPAIAQQKCTLIVLDDDLELEQHNTVSDQ
jgi:hypothetical protein